MNPDFQSPQPGNSFLPAQQSSSSVNGFTHDTAGTPQETLGNPTPTYQSPAFNPPPPGTNPYPYQQGQSPLAQLSPEQQQAYALSNSSSNKSVLAFVLSLIGLTSIGGVIVGIKARKEIRSCPALKGDSLALAAIIIGSVTAVLISLGTFLIGLIPLLVIGLPFLLVKDNNLSSVAPQGGQQFTPPPAQYPPRY